MVVQPVRQLNHKVALLLRAQEVRRWIVRTRGVNGLDVPSSAAVEFSSERPL